MKTNKVKIEDLAIIEKILKTLATKFNHIMVEIEELKDLDSITVDRQQCSLEVNE